MQVAIGRRRLPDLRRAEVREIGIRIADALNDGRGCRGGGGAGSGVGEVTRAPLKLAPANCHQPKTGPAVALAGQVSGSAGPHVRGPGTYAGTRPGRRRPRAGRSAWRSNAAEPKPLCEATESTRQVASARAARGPGAPVAARIHRCGVVPVSATNRRAKVRSDISLPGGPGADRLRGS